MNNTLGVVQKPAEENAFIMSKALCFALYNATRAMNQLYRVHLAEFDLTYTQLLTLAVLWSKSQCSVGEIGDLLHLDTGTLTPLLKRLEQRKIVQRKRSRQDERRVEISLTAEGWLIQEKLMCLPGDLLRDLNMTVTEVTELAARIDTVTKQIEKSL